MKDPYAILGVDKNASDEEVKKAFIKRLNTYLKKYGLSKLHTWTYLVD